MDRTGYTEKERPDLPRQCSLARTVYKVLYRPTRYTKGRLVCGLTISQSWWGSDCEPEICPIYRGSPLADIVVMKSNRDKREELID